MKPPLLLVADHAHPLEALQTAVWNATAHGCNRIAIDIDGLAGFDVPDVRALIHLLRIARGRGADVALQVGSPDRRRALHELGLDRIFAIV